MGGSTKTGGTGRERPLAVEIQELSRLKARGRSRDERGLAGDWPTNVCRKDEGRRQWGPERQIVKVAFAVRWKKKGKNRYKETKRSEPSKNSTG